MGICIITLNKNGKIKEEKAKVMFKQIANGVKCLKDNLILHRDLKPSNIMLTDHGNVKIGDFGVAIKLKDTHERRKSQVGTPNYISPEVINQKPYQFSCDVWSLGCILYIMLVGRPPFESKFSNETLRRARKGLFVLPQTLSEDAKDIITGMLKINTEERMTIENVLNHPFLREAESMLDINQKL